MKKKNLVIKINEIKYKIKYKFKYLIKMKSSEPISNNVNLNDTMLQIIQTLENLKIKRDKINQDIEEGYQLREKIQQQLNLYGEQLQKVTDDLEQKQTVLNIYDKILNESDSAYSKIVQSTQALYNMVKNEEKKFGYQNQ